MRRTLHTIMALLLPLCLLAAQPLRAAAPPRLRIVVTTYPLYDWTRQILGRQIDSVELIQLQNSGVDLHSFQPSAQDIARIAKCDLFVYVGGASDAWTKAALRAGANPRRVALDLVKTLGKDVREEAHLEGMEPHHHHHHEDEDEDEHHHHDEDEDEDEDEHHHHGEDEDEDEHHHHGEDELELDEHVWLSLRFAARLCQSLADRLAQLDAPHAAEYQANCRAFVTQLKELDRRYAAAVSAAPLKTLLFADRFPFRYLMDDYGLTCFAAFSGCSAETEASFKTIAFLSEKVKRLQLPAVLVLEGSNRKIAGTVVKTSGRRDVKILTMDSLQAPPAKGAAQRPRYLQAMENNLKTLRQALGLPE